MEEARRIVLIMTDTQAEVSEVTDEPEQAVSTESEEVEETEKAEVPPQILELLAQGEKIINMLEHFFNPPEEKMEFDYPEEDVKALQDEFGEEKTFNLLTILGDNYVRLLDKAEDPPEPEPAVEAEEEPVIDAETVDEEKAEPEPVEETEVIEEPAEAPIAEESKAETEEEPAIDKSEIIDEIRTEFDEKVKEFEETIAKLAEVRKRTPVPKEEAPKKESLLDQVANLDWHNVDDLAKRGA